MVSADTGPAKEYIEVRGAPSLEIAAARRRRGIKVEKKPIAAVMPSALGGTLRGLKCQSKRAGATDQYAVYALIRIAGTPLESDWTNSW